MPGGLEIGNAPCILFSRNIPEQLYRSEQLPISPGRYPINRLAFSSVVRVAKMAMASEEPPLSTFNPQSVRCRLPSARRWFRLVHRCWRHRRLTCRSFRSSPRSLIISFSPQLCVGVVLSAGISISYSARGGRVLLPGGGAQIRTPQDPPPGKVKNSGGVRAKKLDAPSRWNRPKNWPKF